MHKWIGPLRAQAINQVELQPIFVAINTWASRLKGRDVIMWIDNEAARCGTIKGTSPIDISQELISKIWHRLTEIEAYPWFARVPSVGNPADDPSRLVTDELIAQGWKKVSPCF